MTSHQEHQDPGLHSNHQRIRRISQAALMAALAYIGFQFLRIDVYIGGGKTAFHLGNTFLVMGTLLLGGPWGGLAGAVGMTIADLTAGYAQYAPTTFILKMAIGLITGAAAKRLRLKEQKKRGPMLQKALLASAAGLGFNVVADPVLGYFVKRYLWGMEAKAADILAKMSGVTTFVNAVLGIILASLAYVSLKPSLSKAKLLD